MPLLRMMLYILEEVHKVTSQDTSGSANYNCLTFSDNQI